MSELLLSKIETVRRKQAAVAVVSTLGMLATMLVGLLAVEMLLDWWLDFPRALRALLLAGDLSAMGWVAWRYMIGPVVMGPDDDRIALQVEEAEPEFRHRLIASVQLGRPGAIPVGASASLVQALIAQTEELAQRVDFSRVVKIDRLIRLVVIGAVALLLGLAGLALGSSDNVSIDLLKRAFLSDTPVPRKTHVEVLSGNIKVARGDGVEIRARAKGVIPLSGTLYVEGDSGRRQEFQMTPTDDDKSVFSCKLDNVQESLTYRVKLNDGRSDDWTVTALLRPEVVSVEVSQVYPAYTRLGTVSRSLGDLTILRGSRLELKVTSNHAVSRSSGVNVVHIVGPTSAEAAGLAGQRAALKDVAMNVESDPTVLTADLDLPAMTTGFSINLVDDDGLHSKDPVVYRVDLVADKPPTVRIVVPEQREEPVTRVEKHVIVYEATDDFGLRKVWLKYRVDDGPEQEKVLASPSDDKSLRGRLEWDLSTVPAPEDKPMEGRSIEYWVEAQDNNDVTGPGRGASDHYTLKVVSDQELREYIYSQLNQVIDGVKVNTEDLEELKERMGAQTTRPAEPQK